MTSGERILDEDDFMQMPTSQLAQDLSEAVRGTDGSTSEDFMRGVVAGISLLMQSPKDRFPTFSPEQFANLQGLGREAAARVVDAWEVPRGYIFEERN